MSSMLKIGEFKLNRGRPPKDADWSALVENARHLIENNEDSEKNLLKWAVPPRGCSNGFRGSVYQCKFYLGGAQRHIARGTLYQCAKFYDCALIFFEKYRVRKADTRFNFSKADAEHEMLKSPEVGRYLESLEKYLVESGALKLPVATDPAAQKEKQQARSRKRTIAGAIESWMGELQPYIFDILDAQDAAMKTLKAIETRLAIIETHLKIVP